MLQATYENLSLLGRYHQVSHFISSEPVASLTLKWSNISSVWTTSSFCPGIRQVTFPQTTHWVPIMLSFLDQITYTFSASPEGLEFIPANNFEGPEVAKAPGLNPSTLLQVGIVFKFQHAVRPKLAPASPMKFLTLLFREGPT